VTELLRFYQRLVRFQKTVYESVASSADHDVSLLVPHFAALLALVKEAGSADLKAAATTLENSSPEDRLDLLRAVWQHEVESHELSAESVFFANALLQPFAEQLAEKNTSTTEASSTCRCSSRRSLITCAWTHAIPAIPTSSQSIFPKMATRFPWWMNWLQYR
jgi:formate dehydrogenase maturation protein FdhE